LERAKAIKGIKGVKLHPVTNLIKPYSKFTAALMHRAAELSLPVFFHCGDEIAALPLEIGEGAALCPETTIICHMGGFFHGEESIRMAAQHPNVILDTSSVPYPEIIKRAVTELGSERVVFATDNPAGDPISEVKKIRNIGFSEQDEENIMWRNMARLLKLTEIRGNKL
ncbi:MAG: amidohydrolase family protein, partial [Oscillospiraceae bacterium]